MVKVISFCCVLMVFPLKSYHKCRYLVLPNKPSLYNHISYKKQRSATYVIENGQGAVSYVWLTKNDKKKIYATLGKIDKATPINDPLIKSYLESNLSSHYVTGLVLQDFKSIKSDITMQEIFQRIGLP